MGENSKSVKHDDVYCGYVLVTFMIVYLVNQLDVFCLIATNQSMAQEVQYGDRVCDVRPDGNYTELEEYIMNGGENMSALSYCQLIPEPDNHCDQSALCYWRYLGRGTLYQLLAGPLFIVVFAVSGIPLGLAAELHNLNRKVCLVVCMLLWSIMTILGGFATSYWHLAVSRMLLGVFSAGCVPFCTSILADYFGTRRRGAALGLFNWGVFIGYSMTFVLLIAEKKLGWRAVYFIAGVPGAALAFLVACTVKEPKRSTTADKVKPTSEFSKSLSKLRFALLHFLDPVLLLLCFAGAIRNGAGLVWAYNIVLFFDEYWPEVDVSSWMSWIPLVFASLGAFGGGYVSDRLAGNKGVKGRLIIIIASCLLAAPLQVGTLYAPPIWCWVTLILALLVGEAWLGVCAAVVIELAPANLTASSIAVYFFIIQIIGGNMNLFITPITNSLDLRTALLITFPGLYVLGGLLFLLTLFVFMRRRPVGKNTNSYDTDRREESDDDKNEPLKQSEEDSIT